MKQFNDYASVKVAAPSEKLPVGGYIIKIEGVRYENGKDGRSDKIVLAFDIAEGEYKGFMRKKFEGKSDEDKKWPGTFTIFVPLDDGTEDDYKTKSRFKRVMQNFEASNPGYTWTWDENTLKGKMLGAIVGEIQTIIDGKQVSYTAMRFAESVENIRAGKFKVPDTQYKGGATANTENLPLATNNNTTGNAFVVAEDSELPF